MRVAMLSKAIVVGAYQRKLEELARLPGVDLTVIAPTEWRDSRGKTCLERAYTRGYHLVETPILLNGHYHAHFYPRLRRDLAHIDPDLIHIDEEPYNVASWQAMTWSVRYDRPAVFFTWQNLNRRYPPPFSWIERYLYRHAAHAIAGNQEAAQVLRSKGFRRGISVIPQFGVDPDLFVEGQVSSLAANQLPARLTIGYAGGLVAAKGIDTLLRAVAACQEATGQSDPGVSAPYRLLLAGTGPEEQRLRVLAGQLQISEQVTFLGRLSSTEMPAFYDSIDLLVLPSRTMSNWKEQFGRVLIEAMACQVAVIGSSSGEIPHVIGNAGLVFPEGDAGALASLLSQLATNPEQLNDLGRKGRARVLARFTQRQIAMATWEVYRQVLEHTPHSGYSVPMG